MLCGAAGLIFFLQTTSLGLKLRYPIVECSEEYELYQSDGDLKLDQFKNDALGEFERNYEAAVARKKTRYTGTYQCYCQYMEANHPESIHDEIKLHQELDGLNKMSICDYYFADRVNSRNLGHAITAVIVVFNIILRTVIIKLIQWIK